MMKYVLTIDRMGNYPNVNLEKEDYESIKKAMLALNDGLAIEEKYDILISNYSEFEMEILKQATQLMICLPLSYYDFFESRIGFDRKLVNLLTAATLYRDGLSHHVGKVVGDSAKVDVKALFSKQYDNSIEYRFMEALRNHVQHCELPVHRVQYSPYTLGSGKDRKLVYTMELASQKIFLQENEKFKKKVLKEIPEIIDLKLSTRIYIECISKVHALVRGILSNTLQEYRLLIEKTINSYQESYSDKVLGLYLFCMDGEEEVEKTLLMLDWDNVRLKLIERNPELINLRIRHVSGEIKG
jgi:hypothetical protein